MTNLSHAQHRALELAAQFGDDLLERRPGGFWTYPNCRWSGRHDFAGERVPEVYSAAGTIYALIDRKLFEVAARDASGNVRQVRITFAALDLLKQLGPAL